MFTIDARQRRVTALWWLGPPEDYPQYFPFWLKIKPTIEREFPVTADYMVCHMVYILLSF